MMMLVYHIRDIVRAPRRGNLVGREARWRVSYRAVLIGLLPLLAGCDPVQIVEGSDTHVSIRYDGIANGLDAATRLAQSSCGQYGKIAKLRKTYYEGLGVGERFAFFDCI
jgi:hypothetical protein